MNALTKVMLKRLSRAARPYLKSSGLLQVSGVYNRSALVWEPGAERVVVLAPHMDDETIGCGGTLALHAQRGANVTVVFMTDGRHGSSKLSTLPREQREQEQVRLIETRKCEARLAKLNTCACCIKHHTYCTKPRIATIDVLKIRVLSCVTRRCFRSDSELKGDAWKSIKNR